MEKSLAIRIVGIISLILLSISALLMVLFFFFTNKNEAPMIVYTYILFGALTAITLIFTLMGMFSSKKATLNSLKIIGITAALVLVCYLMSSSAMPTFFGVEEFKLSGSELQLIDTSLFVMYILTGVSFIGLIYSEVRAAFK